jgi:FdhD protein
MSTDLDPGTEALLERARIRRYRGTAPEEAEDVLAREEPLQIRLAGEDVAVTMRTPGHDEELAAGFLYAEGIIAGRESIEAIHPCPPESGSVGNIINVLPTDRTLLTPGEWGRQFVSSSSCGLCGKTHIGQVMAQRYTHASDSADDGTSPWPVSVETLYALPDKLRGQQEAFAGSGGIHAAALFTPAGEIRLMREDVGRHNAVDKVIGRALLDDMLPLRGHILLVSSRASFEIVQKATTAGVELMAVISAPSSLAVSMAEEAGMTLVGFLRQGRLNVYSHQRRIAP